MGFSMTLVLDTKEGRDEHGFDFASAEVATKVADWAEKIDDGRFSCIKELFINGWCWDSTELAAELEVALKSYRPKDVEVYNKLKYVQEEIGIGVPGQQVYIEE